MARLTWLLLVFAACSSKAPPPATTPGGSDTTGSSASTGGSSATAAGSSATAAGSGATAAGSGSACAADATHCCQPDGTIVQPTCSPVVRKPTDSLARGPDGMCKPCPLRCLPPTARIRTPDGEVAVDRLHVGDLVMTAGRDGRPIAAPIVQLRSIPVTGPHSIVAIELADGRTLHASPGHPTATGKPIGSLAIGDRLDGAAVVAIHAEPFAADATWDLLPAGPTGAYWADGILIGSTLR
ncbi:MAG: Hint domain-containing protein [Acidobacteriota bacterium]